MLSHRSGLRQGIAFPQRVGPPPFPADLYDCPMDPNTTGRDRAPNYVSGAGDGHAPAPRPRPDGGRNGPTGAFGGPRFGPKRRRAATLLAIGAVIALVGGFLVFRESFKGEAGISFSPTESGPGATQTIAGFGSSAGATVGPSESGPTSAVPSQSTAATPPAGVVPLPALLGAIGDSYSQAWSVSPSYMYNHTQFSWVIGTSKTDGVLSLLERFRDLGGSPVVVDAATSGRAIGDAERQAEIVVAAAAKLGPGKTAYVTFELGTNDICASPNPMTDTALFDGAVRTAVTTLRTGLPVGSRILILSIPDFPHFHTITTAYAPAKAKLARRPSDQCAPYLGTNGPATTTVANRYLASYDASLKAACDDINAHEGATGRLSCTYNAALLAESDFKVSDLSTYDYFHPSLTGQAKMAANAWRADAWASRKLP